MSETSRFISDFARGMNTELDDIPDSAWDEVSDPASFAVGSLLTLFYRRRSLDGTSDDFMSWSEARREGNRRGMLLGARIGATLSIVGVMVAVTLLPLLVGSLLPSVGAGDGTAYALTVLFAGAVTLVPGRISELRDKQRLRGQGYPRKLRKVLWNIEICITAGAVVLLGIWEPVGLGRDESIHGVIWGLLAVAMSDLLVLSYVKGVALTELTYTKLAAEASAQTPKLTLPPGGAGGLVIKVRKDDPDKGQEAQ